GAGAAPRPPPRRGCPPPPGVPQSVPAPRHVAEYAQRPAGVGPGAAPPGPFPPGPEAHLAAPPPNTGHPPVTGQPPYTGQPPNTGQPPRPSLADRAAAIGGARLLAWTGAALTLLGVVMFLALAVSRGWFAPPVRIGAGTALGLGLIGLGWWLHRKESARVGALAVAATGFATLYLVIAGATAVYGYLDRYPAIGLALVVAVAGLGLADRWQAGWLAHGVSVGALVLAPLLTDGWLLVALAQAMAVAALPVVLRRRWPTLALLVGGISAVYATVVCGLQADAPAASGLPGEAVVLALVTLLIGLVTAGLAARRLPPAATAALAPTAAVPALVTGIVLGGWSGAALAAGAGLALAATAAIPWLRGAPRLAAMTSAAVALFTATLVAFDGSTLTLVLLGQALVAAVIGHRLRSRFATVGAAAVFVPGLVRALVVDAPVADLIRRPRLLDVGAWLPTDGLLVAAGVSALVIAVASMLLAAFVGLGWVRSDAGTAPLWASLGVVGLYGATGLVVNLALLVDLDYGFTAGHALVTVSWAVAAMVLLARGISRPALRVAGMALVGAAVAKLVLFDLGALDGVARVAAFVGAGLVLLAAGTRYARLITEHQQAGPRT
ncbi:MAG: DUF2339 domain-containing protein, partial [Pseudonocardia sp.]|nr:DUF2339 domain-containing protein [Pseudonocardia sp.]